MFKYSGQNQKIIDATNKANDKNMHKGLKTLISQNIYDMSSAPSPWLANMFISFIQSTWAWDQIHVKTYWNPFGLSIAKYKPAYPDNIYLNTAKLRRSKGSIVGTLMHEAVHMLDDQTVEHSFGHGSNDKTGKENTAPYKIGNLAKAIVDNEFIDPLNNENHYIKTSTPLIKRIRNFFSRWF